MSKRAENDKKARELVLEEYIRSSHFGVNWLIVQLKIHQNQKYTQSKEIRQVGQQNKVEIEDSKQYCRQKK